MTVFDLSQVVFRPAGSDDVSALAEFIEPFVAEGRLLPRTIDEIEELIASGFVAEWDGRIVGFAALEIYSRKLAEIRSLAVAHELHGRGIGKKLIEACVDRAKEKNIFEVMAITSNEGIFLSSGFDFTLPGEKKALFIQTRDEHG
jgi:N-acetylglutamate synthase-like GNAT family acetyltransferase